MHQNSVRKHPRTNDLSMLGKSSEIYNSVTSDKISSSSFIYSDLPTSTKLTSANKTLSTTQAKPISSTPFIKSRFQYLYGNQISKNPGTMDTLNCDLDNQFCLNKELKQVITQQKVEQSNEKFNSIDINHLSQPKCASRNEELFTSNTHLTSNQTINLKDPDNNPILFSDLDLKSSLSSQTQCLQNMVPNFSSTSSFLHPLNSRNSQVQFLDAGHIPISHERNATEDPAYLSCYSTEWGVPNSDTEDEDHDSWGSSINMSSSFECESPNSLNSSGHSIYQSWSEQSKTTPGDDTYGIGSGEKSNSGIIQKVGLQECHQNTKKRKFMAYITSPHDVYGQDSRLFVEEE